MSENFYPLKKIAEIFGQASNPQFKQYIQTLQQDGTIPNARKFRSGALFRQGWHESVLPKIGERLGFFPKFNRSVAMSVFTTKGGVLKSTLALNIARVAALHNIRTCVVGLDIQGDVTTALGFENDLDEARHLGDVIARIDATRGLTDFFHQSIRLSELIRPTDLPSLFLIPETPELAALNDSLNNINRREYWLKEKVINPLKQEFDLVIMDCSPNWNKLTTNALVASDVLVSPLECKINNFRNFKVFRQFLKEFKNEMHMHFESIFIPTRFSTNRKLSMEIKEWYQANVPGCTHQGIKESVLGEEATALHRSIIEHTPNKDLADHIREVLVEIHERIEKFLGEASRPSEVVNKSKMGYIRPKSNLNPESNSLY